MSNKYARHYKLLTDKAKARGTVEGYSETHHVVPRSLGGPDDDETLVVLTAREHFLAHLLLHKINPNHSGMAYAVLMMSGQGKHNGRTYEILKRSAARVIGEQAREFMLGRPKPEEQKQNMSKAALLRPPEHLAKIAEANRGRKNTADAKVRMSKAALDRSPEAKQNIRLAARSPERAAKLSKALKGIRHDVTEETREKISQTMKGKMPSNMVTVVCPHCGKEGNAPIMARWHFDNCGKGHSEKSRQHMRELKLGTKLSAETKAKISAAHTGKKTPRVKCPHCEKVGGQGLMKRWHFDNCNKRSD